MKEDLKKRTKSFAIDIWRLCQSLPLEFVDYKRQLVRCSSSVGANYRAACRAKSTKDFINKLKIVEEELDESLYFIELISELSDKVDPKWTVVYNQGDKLLAIFVKSITTLKQKQSNSSVIRNP